MRAELGLRLQGLLLAARGTSWCWKFRGDLPLLPLLPMANSSDFKKPQESRRTPSWGLSRRRLAAQPFTLGEIPGAFWCFGGFFDKLQQLHGLQQAPEIWQGESLQAREVPLLGPTKCLSGLTEL